MILPLIKFDSLIHLPLVKKFIASLLALLILSQTLVNVGLGIYYHFNKVFITKQLCENKNNPKIHCNGHCYLAKQLKKAEEGENKSTQALKEKEEIISSTTNELNLVYIPSLRVIKIRIANLTPVSTKNSLRLLKPPMFNLA